MSFLSSFLKIANQLKVYHWQTTSYAEHKAFGKAYEQLEPLIDSFIEIYISKTGRPTMPTKYELQVNSYTDQYDIFLKGCIQFLVGLGADLSQEDTDLLNIRDEMLATINQLRYLLSLS